MYMACGIENLQLFEDVNVCYEFVGGYFELFACLA